MTKLTDEAKRMGAVLSDETLEQLGKFDDSIQRLKAGGAAAKNASAPSSSHNSNCWPMMVLDCWVSSRKDSLLLVGIGKKYQRLSLLLWLA